VVIEDHQRHAAGATHYIFGTDPRQQASCTTFIPMLDLGAPATDTRWPATPAT
jgi:hypothetical protein